ncbi:MAG TPA: DUF4012 domain-containing protein [Acidimicrobiales bacterium]|nr:DUF4012 domain-containing protein [Acidimicrobiales bacterium]
MSSVAAAATALVFAAVVVAVGRRQPGVLAYRNPWFVRVVAALAALGAAFAPPAPTAWHPLDIAYRSVAGLLVTLAASRARRWSWLVASGLAVAGLPGGWAAAVAGGSLGVASGASIAGRRGRVLGALVGAAALQGLMRGRWPETTGVTTLMFLVGAISLAVSGLRRSRRRVQRQVRTAVLVVSAATVAFVILAVLSVAKARGPATAAVDASNAGLDAARQGHVTTAAQLLEGASAKFDEAHHYVDLWWARVGRAVPLVAQNQEALVRLTAEGHRVAAVGTAVARSADPHSLAVHLGQVDLGAITRLGVQVRAARSAVGQAQRTMAIERGPWILPPLRDRMDRFGAKLDRLSSEEATLDAATSALPGLLGDAGPRRYLVAVVDNSELRGGGGLMADYGVLTAEGGQVSLGPLTTPPAGMDLRLTGLPALWEAAEGYVHLGTFPQDATFAPDFPTDADAIEQLYGQVVGPVDGVVAVDPVFLTSLLKITGPVAVPGWPVPLNSTNAAQVLLHDQYLSLSGAPRQAFLAAATRTIFDRLKGTPLPEPATLAQVVGPAVRAGHFAFWPNDPAGRTLSRQLGVTGAMPPVPAGGDFLEVTSENTGEDKIDWYLHRRISYAVRYDAGTGATEATATIALRNEAPATGEPAYILGGSEAPSGANLMEVEVYTPLTLTGSRLYGSTGNVLGTFINGRHLYTSSIQIPPGGTVTLLIQLTGQLQRGGYRLAIGRQPVITEDQFALTVTYSGSTAAHWQGLAAQGDGSTFHAAFPLVAPLRFAVTAR